MSALRRLDNRIQRWFDRRSLQQPQVLRLRPPGGGVPCVLSYALEQAVREAQQFDRDARLKHVLAPQGVASDGAGRRWEFVFDLPERRAKLLARWYLDGDLQAGRFGRECLDADALPFPVPDSPLAQAIAAGRAAYAQAIASWREERRRTPDLPLGLRDSDAVAGDLERLGLRVADGAFVLRNAIGPKGEPVWLAQVGEQQFHCRFT